MKPPPIALVTGANKGIGLETTRQLGRKGIFVFLASRDFKKGWSEANKLTALGIECEAVELDVTKLSTIRAAARIVTNRFGRLDILVNNAAISVDDQNLRPSEQSPKMWQRTFETNLFGLIAVTQVFLPLLRKSEAARIVNLSSGLASLTTHADPKGGLPKNLPAYAVSKTAVNAWTIHLADELKETSIKVNSADPGWVKTDLGGPDAPLEVEEGAITSVDLATLNENGPSGGFIKLGKPIPW